MVALRPLVAHIFPQEPECGLHRCVPAPSPTHLADEAEAIHIFREVAAEFERPLLFSGGKDSVASAAPGRQGVRAGARCRSRAARRHRSQLPPRSSTTATGPWNGWASLVVGSVQDYIDRRWLAERADGTRNPLQTIPLLDAIEGTSSTPSSAAAPRRGQGPGQGTHPEPARRVRPVGPAQPAPRAVEPLQRPPHAWAVRPCVPDQQLDRAGRLALHRARKEASSCRASTTPTTARSSAATACGEPGEVSQPRPSEESSPQDGPLPHRRRHVLHRRRRVGRRARCATS